MHYAAATWLQCALLSSALPGMTKAALVFLGAVDASWAVVAALRRIPAVGRMV
jgi:hypothetical protein